MKVKKSPRSLGNVQFFHSKKVKKRKQWKRETSSIVLVLPLQFIYIHTEKRGGQVQLFKNSLTKREMGSTQKKDPIVSHFSHPHPLECTTEPSTGNNVRCFGCNLRIVTHGDQHYYRCKTCAFFLHQVCYKMPLITNHPSHPRHDLVLLLIPSSPPINAIFTLNNCVACRNHVTGLCYHCAECNIFFHALCMSLPLSLSITHHPHKIKLEFSPPYDFFCDLCNKPSYKGWLYRCSMCEFDIHLACALENIEPKLSQLPQSNALIMRLVAQQIGGKSSRSSDQEDFDSAIAWDEKLYSPIKKGNTNSSGKLKDIVELELQEETELISFSRAVFSGNNLEERTPLRDKMTLNHNNGTPSSSSHQLSDSYFSIDLAKSYSTHHERTSQVRREGISSDHIITRSVAISSNSTGRVIEEPIGVANWPNNDSHNMAHQINKPKAISDFVESSQKVVVRNPKDQTIVTTKSESVSSITLVVVFVISSASTP